MNYNKYYEIYYISRKVKPLYTLKTLKGLIVCYVSIFIINCINLIRTFMNEHMLSWRYSLFSLILLILLIEVLYKIKNKKYIDASTNQD